ncbi:tetratricopeptide repeat-containing glycosyltransferase family 2 protein [Halalkalibacter wakoensis]|nr:glycosyltransferase family 2 protein [Halalkalibacter wakoensis]
MNGKVKVSICMMVKDEEMNLDRCLKSLKPIIDAGIAELIIVDTGSKDKTLEIAKSYTSQVFEHPWTNNFSEMRNRSISYARGEWIWIMDADEEVVDAKDVISFFECNLSKYNTFSIEMKNYMETGNGKDEPRYNVSILNRGFRNTKDFRFKGAIHNQPQFKEPIVFSDILINHYGYIWEDEEFKKKKFDRTAGILKQELKKDPSNVYYQYQLGVSTSIINKEKGLIEFRKAHELIRKLPRVERVKFSYTYGVYARNAFQNKEYMESISICQEGLGYANDYIDLWYILTISYAAISDNENTVENARGFLECKKRFNRTKISKDPAFTFYHYDEHSEITVRSHIANISIKNGEITEAKKQLKKMPPSKLKTIIAIEIGKKYEDIEFLLEVMKEAFSNDDTKNHFISKLEEQLSNNIAVSSRDIVSFYNNQGLGHDEYYFLNVLRVQMDNQQVIDTNILDNLLKLNYDETPYYYGDIIKYIVTNKLDIQLFSNFGKVENVEKLLATDSEGEDQQVIDYLNLYKSTKNIRDLKYWLVLAQKVLLREQITNASYLELFKVYIETGNTYISNIYLTEVLNEGNVYDIPKAEHRFFCYMSKALKIKEKDQQEYVKYLRKALKELPLKKGIELLVDQVKNQQQQAQDEMNLLKTQFKNNIRVLIENKKIKEAKALIQQYEQMVQGDVEILLFKSEILILTSND